MKNPYPQLSIVTVLCAVLLAACAGSPTEKSTGDYVDDAVLTTKVKAALVQSDAVHAVDVNVDTYKGVVQLHGFVDSRAEAEEAARIASGIAGVKRVDNKLELKPAD